MSARNRNRAGPSAAVPAAVRRGAREPVKLVLVGDTGVGKSSVAVRFVRDKFEENPENTLVAGFLQKLLLVDGQMVKFNIWDTAGTEQFRSIIPLYYRDAKAAVIVYDISDRESFRSVRYWHRELRRHGSPNMKIALVGNKADRESMREVRIEEGQEFAVANDLFFTETSAKTALNVGMLFGQLANLLAIEGEVGEEDRDGMMRETVDLKIVNKRSLPQVRKRCCRS